LESGTGLPVMFEPILDLYGPTSWNYVFRRTLEAVDGNIPNSFLPIPSEIVVCNSNLVLIGCKSPRPIPPTWRIGCWASLNLNLLPDTQTEFPPFVEVVRKAISFEIFSMLICPKYPPNTFFLKIDIPYWLESVYIEALAYDGVNTTRESQQIEEILQKL
jgi:hypothetical protein